MRALLGRTRLWLLVCGAVGIAGCAGQFPLDDREMGIIESVETPVPGFFIEASPVLVGGLLALEIRTAFTPADLVFSADDGGYIAAVPLAFRVLDRRSGQALASREVRDSLRVGTFEETSSDRQLVRAEVFDVPAGRVVADVALLDVRGAARATRRFEAEVPDGDDLTALPVRLVRGDDYIVGARVPQWRLQDSVRVVTGASDSPAGVAVTLTRGRSDQSVPTPPFWISPPYGSIVYRGAAFDGDGVDTVMVVSGGPAEIDMPLLEEGVYMLSTLIAGADAPGRTHRRPLIVLPEGHPRVETIDGLIEALAYIAYPSELDEMRAGVTSADRRNRFDAFWASLFEVRQVAEQTMRLYYSRIEEANRQFTTHAPGWITDRGMVYVVLGPPELVERTLDGEVWRYSGRQAGGSYFFERVSYFPSPWHLEHHVLHRSPRYEADWQRAVRRWRRGEVR
jgi:GWxTD domain-containing protein